MSDKVWISRAMNDTRLIVPVETDLASSDPQRLIRLEKLHRKGEHIAVDDLPDALYADPKIKPSDRLPSLFFGNGLLFVSGECAEVLERFDLGSGGLKPIEVFQHDQSTPIEGSYFALNFGARKDCFVREASAGAWQPFGPDQPVWWQKPEVKDREIAVTRSALEGADLWTDIGLQMGFFVSDQLAKALREAKLATRFGLRSCRIV